MLFFIWLFCMRIYIYFIFPFIYLLFFYLLLIYSFSKSGEVWRRCSLSSTCRKTQNRVPIPRLPMTFHFPRSPTCWTASTSTAFEELHLQLWCALDARFSPSFSTKAYRGVVLMLIVLWSYAHCDGVLMLIVMWGLDAHCDVGSWCSFFPIVVNESLS